MANSLTEKDTTEGLEPRVDRDKPLARVQALPWLLLILALAAVAWLSWRAFFYDERADPVGSAMLAFEKQNSLTVFSSRFEVVAESEDSRGVLNLDILNSRQLAVIPAQVEYRIDLAAMDRDRFAWDEASETLTVILPPLRVSRPNLDEAAARTFTEGAWVTRDASEDLARNNSRQAERKASAFARNPQILALARTAAKEAVRQNLAIPMQVAGYGDVSVEVRFDGQALPE
jgi:hypothetical protein